MQRIDHACVQPGAARRRKLVHRSAWMNARRKKNFIRVNIADASDHTLVEQRGFYRTAAAAQTQAEFIR